MHISSFTPESKQLTYQLFSSPSTKEKEIGLFVHDFLSSLTKFPQTFQEIEEMDLAMDEEKKSMVKGALKKIIADKTLKPYFFTEAEVLNEISILKTDGSVRRPDRIVITSDEVMVIDYKTGKENSKYQEQLEEYKSLLIEMGYKNVQGRLVFV
jgi:ATP-dependent exoDNAse (exonuclease V) beta subunit